VTTPPDDPRDALRRFDTLDDLVRQVGLRRDEAIVLAEVGALNSFGMDRRTALWQIERVVRPAGELFEREGEEAAEPAADEVSSPLEPMTGSERLVADYAGTSLTIGPHPMAFRRHELSMRGVTPASELSRLRSGRRVRTAGMVITRQRPGTAKGFVFLSLEDETGILNVVVTPKRFERQALMISTSPLLLVRGTLQVEHRVVNLRGERFTALQADAGESWARSHDFH
jgi:error-prone DNA polymerase